MTSPNPLEWLLLNRQLLKGGIMKIYARELPLEAANKEFEEIFMPGLLGSEASDLDIGKEEVPEEHVEIEMLLGTTSRNKVS
jgi:hypothetical protein